MKLWPLGCGVFFLVVSLQHPTTAPALSAQGAADACPAGKPFTLTKAITPVHGKAPLWISTGSGPIVWKSADDAAQLMVVRDAAARGRAFLSGTNRATGAKAKFMRTGSTLGVRHERLELDQLGIKPKLATPDDFKRYVFELVDAWFPEPGCYDVTGRIGTQQATIVLSVGKRPTT